MTSADSPAAVGSMTSANGISSRDGCRVRSGGCAATRLRIAVWRRPMSTTSGSRNAIVWLCTTARGAST
jgi:hypothetical protein